jgi:di/tricarboxylate transporter
MLIGEALDLSFAGYAVEAAPVAVIGLALAWAVLRLRRRL